MAGRFIAKEVIDRHGAFINRGDHEREVRELLDRIAELEARHEAPYGDYENEECAAVMHDFGFDEPASGAKS